jgi:antitoxin component YwqK of YwqJK toxin-antitoxin module
MFLLACKGKFHKEFYENGQVKSIYHTKKEKIQGEYKEFYKNGNRKKIEHYKDGVKHGEVLIYYKNGDLDTKYTMQKGLIDGKMISYYKNGKLRAETDYKNGKPHGIVKHYYPNGRLESVERFENGIRQGIGKSYYTNGKLEMIKMFKDEEFIFWEEYDSTGKFIRDFRKVKIESKSDTITLGETYRAKLKLLGPINIGTIEYWTIGSTPLILGKPKHPFKKYGNELQKEKEKGLISIKAKDTGRYLYAGVVIWRYDSVSFPRYYAYEKEFYVQSKE